MLPDVMGLLRGRRTTRRFEDKPVDVTVMRMIIEAGTWAPSAHNAQPWRFAVVLGYSKKTELADMMGRRWGEDLRKDGIRSDVIEAMVRGSRNSILGTPALIVVCIVMQEMDSYPDERRAELERIMAIQSASACIQNMLLMAHALGLGACWRCAPLFAPEEAKRALNLDAEWEPVALIGVGHPAETPQPPFRKPIEEVSVWL